MFGKGLVSNDVVNFISFSYDVKNWDEIAELLSEYHHNLCLNGVNDYPFEDFILDVKIATSESVVEILKNAADISPGNIKKLMKGMAGEKGEEFVNVVTKKGGLAKNILLLTGIYVSDKDNFLIAYGQLMTCYHHNM